jgi:hypothetical protein
MSSEAAPAQEQASCSLPPFVGECGEIEFGVLKAIMSIPGVQGVGVRTGEFTVQVRYAASTDIAKLKEAVLNSIPGSRPEYFSWRQSTDRDPASFQFHSNDSASAPDPDANNSTCVRALFAGGYALGLVTAAFFDCLLLSAELSFLSRS